MRWFTYCRTDGYGSPLSVEAARERNIGLGLLFGSDSDADNVSLSDADTLVVLPEIRKMFAHGCAAQLVDLGSEPALLICSALSVLKSRDTVTPDNANDDTPTYIVGVGHQVFEYNLVQRYNACTSLIKYMGCEKCDARGYSCAVEAIPFLPTLQEEAGSVRALPRTAPKIDTLIGYKDGVTRLGDFTFRKPGLTKRYGRKGAIRGWRLHSFRCAEEVAEDNKKTAEASAATRAQKQFEKAQCTRCFVSSECGRGFRKTCTGALPVEEVAIQDILAHSAYLLQRNFTQKELFTALRHLDVSETTYADSMVSLEYEGGLWKVKRRVNYQVMESWDTFAGAAQALGWSSGASDEPTDLEKARTLGWVAVNAPKNETDRLLLRGSNPDRTKAHQMYGLDYGYYREVHTLSDLFGQHEQLPGVAHGKYRKVTE